MTTLGRLIGIARRAKSRQPMETMARGTISMEAGLQGDHKGARFPKRQITVLSREAWEAALSDLACDDLHWTVRRANLLVEGVALPRAKGALVRVGPVVLEVTAQTYPCRRMEQARPGLMKALAPEWRGGITTRVLNGGDVEIGCEVEVLVSPPEHVVRLP